MLMQPSADSCVVVTTQESAQGGVSIRKTLAQNKNNPAAQDLNFIPNIQTNLKRIQITD